MLLKLEGILLQINFLYLDVHLDFETIDRTVMLHQHFVRVARKHRKKLAFIDRTTQHRVTYGKALIGALVLSKKLRPYASGYLGIMIPTSAGCALTIVGSLMSGRIPVMINYATGAQENARFALKRCGFRTIITSKALLEKIGCPVMEGMVFIEEIMASITTGEKIRAALTAMLPSGIINRLIHRGDREDNAVVLFTSGSEKEPKAVQLSHRSIIFNIKSFGEYLRVTGEDILLANLVLFHVFGLVVNLWAGLYYGMTLITYANPTDFKAISRIAREEGPTVMVGTPSLFRGYLQKSDPGDFQTLRFMVAGADKCPESLREGFISKHGVTLLEGYGTTETIVISANSLEYNRPGSIGRVIPGVKVRIEELETGEECQTGQKGRILVQGDLVMNGYLGEPDLTRESMKDGWYNTGDIGYFDEEGYLWYAGRFRRFVKIGGEMISLARVEDVMEKHLPEGVLCCMAEIPDEVKGATIVAAVTEEIDKPSLLSKMKKELPNMALPRKFFVIPELPVMSTGKIDFRKVTEMIRQLLDQ